MQVKVKMVGIYDNTGMRELKKHWNLKDAEFTLEIPENLKSFRAVAVARKTIITANVVYLSEVEAEGSIGDIVIETEKEVYHFEKLEEAKIKPDPEV